MTLVSGIPALQPGERLLCGPGPSNVNPKVLEAMALEMNGHLDPDFWDLLLVLVDGLKALWRTPTGSHCASARRAPPGWRRASRTWWSPATRSS